jgi:hypothetical protein
LPSQLDGHRPGQLINRPSLIDYDPVADDAAVVVSSDKMARFTVLTSNLIRMEYTDTPSVFEDHATIAMLNRKLEIPAFASKEADGKVTELLRLQNDDVPKIPCRFNPIDRFRMFSQLVITTNEVTLMYAVGQPFSASSLGVTSNQKDSAFQSWAFGDAFTRYHYSCELAKVMHAKCATNKVAEIRMYRNILIYTCIFLFLYL